MTQEVQAGLEQAQPEIAEIDDAAVKPEIAEREVAEETLEQKVARLEKESHGKQKRIEKLAAKNRVNEETASQYRARLEQIHNAQNQNQKQLTPEDIQRELQTRVHVAEVAAETAATIKNYMKSDPKFAENLKEIAEEAGPMVVNGLPSPLLEAILDCDKPHKVAAFLKANPESAAELDGLSPARLARKLVVIEAGLTASKETKVSSAAKPLQPVKAGGTTNALPPETDRYAWIEARNKQVGRRR